MVSENFHGWLGVRVVRWLETKLRDPHALEEFSDHTNQITQRQVVVSHNAFHLMELSQVSGIHSFIAEHPVDAEQLDWLERLLLSDSIEHLGRDGRRVRSQQVRVSLGPLPLVSVPDTATRHE